MRFGFSPTQAYPTFDPMLQQSKLAESLGFDTIWTHEHHSQAMTYPSPLMALSVLAPHTQRVRLGTNMVLLPLYHPLRVAQDAAMVDVLSGGRLILGVSAGYAPDEYDAFGVSLRQRGKRVREGLRLIRAVWREDPVTLEGLDGRLENFSLFPKPIQQPAPPIYVGALANAAIRRAAQWGDGYVLSAGSTLEQIRERADYYRQAVRDLGQDPAQRPLAVNRVMHVVNSQAAKLEAQQFFAEHFLHLYDSWGHEDIQQLGGGAREYEQTSQQHFIIGEAAECLELIHQYAELGIGHIACLMNFGGPDLDRVEASMRRFADKVMPHCPEPSVRSKVDAEKKCVNKNDRV